MMMMIMVVVVIVVQAMPAVRKDCSNQLDNKTLLAKQFFPLNVSRW